MCRAYGGFASHFPAQADALLHSLDLSYQKLLHGEATLSNSSSSHSLHSVGLSRPPSSLPTQPRLKIGSSENLNRIPGIPPRKVNTSSSCDIIALCVSYNNRSSKVDKSKQNKHKQLEEGILRCL